MDIFVADDASTPLTEEEKMDLIPSWIVLRRELNAVEQENILEARVWLSDQKKKDILKERFIKKLHLKMFGNVWQWAGKYRTTARNIGVEAWQIHDELRKLLDDTQFWIDHKTYEPDEIAARFHHRLVWIHPFPNGNGRLARLMTDILLARMNRPAFTWGGQSLGEASIAREAYVKALRAADGNDIKLLTEFVRS